MSIVNRNEKMGIELLLFKVLVAHHNQVNGYLFSSVMSLLISLRNSFLFLP